ncbi:nucleolin-like [Drosophila willistoni]|uniref:nucleolin-like n=1 Tax=Drosophila willistoni TaxID=7260 RepID=UPI001F085D5E|nr:nucleolin-like [Drosophila willistoni]
MERGDWHRSDEESDDDEPDMMDPEIAASSDEENDEDVEDSGYGSEESEAESVVNPGHQEEEEDDEMWRELDEAVAMMENEVADEESSERNSPDVYAPWDQEEIPEPPAQAWEPARPPTPFRMVDYMSEASESEEEAVAGVGEAEGVASQTPENVENVSLRDVSQNLKAKAISTNNSERGAEVWSTNQAQDTGRDNDPQRLQEQKEGKKGRRGIAK